MGPPAAQAQSSAEPSSGDDAPGDSLVTIAGRATVGTGAQSADFLDVFVMQGQTAVRLMGPDIDAPVAAGDSVVARGVLEGRGQPRVLSVDSYRVVPVEAAWQPEAEPISDHLARSSRLAPMAGRVVRTGGYVAQVGRDGTGPFALLHTSGGPLLVRLASEARLSADALGRLQPDDYARAAGTLLPPARPDGPHRLFVERSEDLHAAWIAPAAFPWAAGAAGVAFLVLLAAFVVVWQQRRRRTTRYEAYFEQASGAQLITRPDWQIEHLNEAAAHLLQDSAGHLKRQNLRRLLYVPGHDEPALPEALPDDAAESEVEASLAERGAERMLQVRTTPFTIDGQAFYSVTLHDVTARNWEATLFKAFHRQTLNDLPIEVAVLSPEGQYLYTNPRINKDALTTERLIGQTDFDYVRTAGLQPEVALRRRAHRRQALQMRERVRFEERLTGPDGGTRHFDRFYTPIFDRQNDPYAIVFYGIETTHLKRKESQAQEAQEEVQRFTQLRESLLENMSHEFRTPLTGILGAAEVLEDESSPAQREFATIIMRNGERLMNTLNAMLDLIGMDGGPREMQPQVADLFEEVGHTAEELRPMAEEKDLYLHVEAVQPDVLVRLDPFFLRRVLHSLVGNALKFTERGGVAVDVFQNDGQACVRVMDTGVGMKEEYLPYLFSAFDQESSGIGRSFEGVGIGLSLAKRLLDRMGGSIDVDSRKGEGSVFTVSFPAALPKAEDGAAPQVLVAEADPEQQRVLRHLLAPRLHPDLAGTVDETVARVQEKTYDAVLVGADLLRAGRNGVSFPQRLREASGNADLPVIGLGRSARDGRAADTDLTDWAAKPPHRERLLQAIAEAMVSAEPAGDDAETPADEHEAALALAS